MNDGLRRKRPPGPAWLLAKRREQRPDVARLELRQLDRAYLGDDVLADELTVADVGPRSELRLGADEPALEERPHGDVATGWHDAAVKVAHEVAEGIANLCTRRPDDRPAPARLSWPADGDAPDPALIAGPLIDASLVSTAPGHDGSSFSGAISGMTISSARGRRGRLPLRFRWRTRLLQRAEQYSWRGSLGMKYARQSSAAQRRSSL